MAGGARSILSILALLLLAGGCLLDFFIVLSGGISGNPINKVYFLNAAIGPGGGTAWTWNAVCQFTGAPGSGTGTTTACGKAGAATPFQPTSNPGGNLPAYFQSNSGFNYAMSKATWALFLVALFFGVLALFSALLAPCSRLISFGASAMSSLAMVIQAAACAVMTAYTVKARNAFRAGGIQSNIGEYAYGFAWSSLVCFFLAMFLFCCGGVASRKKKNKDDEGDDMPRQEKERTGFFARNKAEPQTMGMDGHTGVKDDYS